MNFATDLTDGEDAPVAGGSAYIDMLNEQPADATEPQTVVAEAEAPAPESKKRGRPAGSKAKSAGSKRGRPKKSDSGLKTL